MAALPISPIGLRRDEEPSWWITRSSRSSADAPDRNPETPRIHRGGQRSIQRSTGDFVEDRPASLCRRARKREIASSLPLALLSNSRSFPKWLRIVRRGRTASDSVLSPASFATPNNSPNPYQPFPVTWHTVSFYALLCILVNSHERRRRFGERAKQDDAACGPTCIWHFGCTRAPR